MHAGLDASPWVRRFAGVVPAGEVLDLACGGGRHARLFAALGHPVLAADRDPQALALAAGAGVTTLEVDLEAEGARWPCEPGRFASNLGATATQQCGAMSYSLAGASSCAPCPALSYSLAGASACVSCGLCAGIALLLVSTFEKNVKLDWLIFDTSTS